MKIVSFLFIILISFQLGSAQELDLSLVDFNGLNFYSTRDKIEEKLGGPKRVYEPNYDCGGLSAYWQDQPFYSLVYENIKFTGNDTADYLIEEINFIGTKQYSLTYGEFLLDRNTDIKEATQIFGKQFFNELMGIGEEETLITKTSYEEGLRIVFQDGKLVKVMYWTPC